VKIVSSVLLMVRADEQGIEVLHNRRLGGWVWFNRLAMKMATSDNALTIVYGPYRTCWQAARAGLNAAAAAPLVEAYVEAAARSCAFPHMSVEPSPERAA
jgi:hypothetical protein